jgi:hypothetical protein
LEKDFYLGTLNSFDRDFTLMSFFSNLKVLKGKATKSKGIMPHLKLSKNMFLEQNKFLKTKIITHFDL